MGEATFLMVKKLGLRSGLFLVVKMEFCVIMSLWMKSRDMQWGWM